MYWWCVTLHRTLSNNAWATRTNSANVSRGRASAEKKVGDFDDGPRTVGTEGVRCCSGYGVEGNVILADSDRVLQDNDESTTS